MNRGAIAMRKALEGHGKKAALATDLKINPGMVTRWASGEHKPDAKYRAAIEDKHGVGWRLWDDELEGAELAAALAELEEHAEPAA